MHETMNKMKEGKLGAEYPGEKISGYRYENQEMYIGRYYEPTSAGLVVSSEETLYAGTEVAKMSGRMRGDLGLRRVYAQTVHNNGKSQIIFYRGFSNPQQFAHYGTYIPSENFVDPSSSNINVIGYKGKNFQFGSITNSIRAAEFVATHEVYGHVTLGLGGKMPDEINADKQSYDLLCSKVWKDC